MSTDETQPKKKSGPLLPVVGIALGAIVAFAVANLFF